MYRKYAHFIFRKVLAKCSGARQEKGVGSGLKYPEPFIYIIYMKLGSVWILLLFGVNSDYLNVRKTNAVFIWAYAFFVPDPKILFLGVGSGSFKGHTLIRFSRIGSGQSTRIRKSVQDHWSGVKFLRAFTTGPVNSEIHVFDTVIFV